MSRRILVLNPGTTSTKVAVFEETRELWRDTIEHDSATLHGFDSVAVQLDYRHRLIEAAIPADRREWTAVVGRGGLLRPVEGGTYAVNETMLTDVIEARHGEHASNLGPLLADRFAREVGVEAYVVDPVTTDEFGPLPRISGVPGIERKCRAHALNIKAVARRVAAELAIPFARSRFVVAHLGGGVSIAALAGGRIEDVNDALLGMGPFSPERAGALPLRGVLDLVRDKGLDETKAIFSRRSGFAGYFGTADLREVEAMIDAGNELAALVFEAMLYQVAKEIGACAAVLAGDLHGVILTGGLAHSQRLCEHLRPRIDWLPGGVHTHPGEQEMRALAEGALRVLEGEETAKSY